jgi:uncharacterized flavoprotein (TIGR03862 family)
MPNKTIAIIGGGPAGLMAAEILSREDFIVTIYERKPSPARKFLMAGRGGLNLTHSEVLDSFLKKYGPRSNILNDVIRDFPPQALRDWCEGLGQKTFVGSSGRVFPESFKASPLLRAWITRLEEQGVRFMVNHDWRGWQDNKLFFDTLDGYALIESSATLLALGGASWPRLGADGSWLDILEQQGVGVAPLRPANVGFAVEWSDVFREKFTGKPLKPVVATFQDTTLQGEIMITDKGVEGGVIYALSSALRDAAKPAVLMLDLKPDITMEHLQERLKKPRGRESFSNYLRKTLNLSPLVIGLLMEREDRKDVVHYTPEKLAGLIKHYPLPLQAAHSIDRAISTAGGITFDSVDQNFMLTSKPGVFVAGEMLDWEAPTGGYLLQACFATGVHAAKGIISWLSSQS